jgi:regulator of sirC expression with transglutaminase-like and TPR domain
LLLTPDAPDALRNRGLVYERLELHAAALADFERSLLLAPSDPLAATVRARVMNLRTGARRLH